MKNQPIMRDERTLTVENASYRIAFHVISFGVLLIVAYRGFFLQQSGWDLLALVILSSGIATFYQGTHKILPRRTLIAGVVTFLIALIIAAALALIR